MAAMFAVSAPVFTVRASSTKARIAARVAAPRAAFKRAGVARNVVSRRSVRVFAWASFGRKIADTRENPVKAAVGAGAGDIAGDGAVKAKAASVKATISKAGNGASASVKPTVASFKSEAAKDTKDTKSDTTPDAAEFEVPEVLTETLDKVSAAWEKTDDKPAVVTLGVFGFVGLIALAGVLRAVESLPLIPDALELIGIAYSLWFTYRYLLFKPDREELKASLSKYKDQILG